MKKIIKKSIFRFFKIKRRYAESYYDLTNYYCQQIKGERNYYQYERIYIRRLGGNYNEIYVADKDDNAILICKISPKTTTSSSGPFSITRTIGTNFDWHCGDEEQTKIIDLLDKMDEYLLEKEDNEKDNETKKIEEYNRKVANILQS